MDDRDKLLVEIKELAAKYEAAAWDLRKYGVCQRCEEIQPIRWRVYSDLINLRVCTSCAADAPAGKGDGHLTVERLPEPIHIAAPIVGAIHESPLQAVQEEKEIEILIYETGLLGQVGNC
jgi:hypothetical protein